MKRQYDGYAVVPFPPVRRMIVDVLEMGHRKHTIHGLAEVDVTRVRQYIREYEATSGKDLSFTAFIVACIGKAVERNKYMHAYRSGRNHLVLFDEVDVNTQIEIEIDGRKVPIPHTIKAANKRTVRDIHQEIRRVQAEGEKSESAPTSGGEKLFMALPDWIQVRKRVESQTTVDADDVQGPAPGQGKCWNGVADSRWDVWRRGWLGDSAHHAYPGCYARRYCRKAGRA